MCRPKVCNFLTVALIVVPLTLHASKSHAGWDIDGERLLDACTSDSAMPRGICGGIIVGTIQMMPYSVRPCKGLGLADAYSLRTLKDIVVKFLKEHPEMRILSAGTLVSGSIEKSFCPRK